MYTKTDSHYFLQSGGRPYNEPGDGDPHAGVPEKDQYFFNFSDPLMPSFWNETIILGPHGVSDGPQKRCVGRVVVGLFIDDSTGIGAEHKLMLRKCGLSPADVSDWNAKVHATSN